MDLRDLKGPQDLMVKTGHLEIPDHQDRQVLRDQQATGVSRDLPDLSVNLARQVSLVLTVRTVTPEHRVHRDNRAIRVSKGNQDQTVNQAQQGNPVTQGLRGPQVCQATRAHRELKGMLVLQGPQAPQATGVIQGQLDQ